MSGLNKSLVLLSMVSSLLLLGACGSDDAETASAPMAESAPAAPAASSDGDTISMESIEKAEGVVYQDEIYAKWPK